ncbi:hypothetical protein MRX96_053493 [Rhipicephalus microplus]
MTMEALALRFQTDYPQPVFEDTYLLPRFEYFANPFPMTFRRTNAGEQQGHGRWKQAFAKVALQELLARAYKLDDLAPGEDKDSCLLAAVEALGRAPHSEIS